MYIVVMKTNNLHQLVWMSRPLMQAAEICVEAGLVGTSLTVRMRAVLEILQRHGALTVPEIAAKLEIKRQYVQVMCVGAKSVSTKNRSHGTDQSATGTIISIRARCSSLANEPAGSTGLAIRCA